MTDLFQQQAILSCSLVKEEAIALCI